MQAEKNASANDRQRLLTAKDLCGYLGGWGEARAVQWAKEHGAARRIGRRVFFDRVALDSAIDRLTEKGSEV